MKKISLLLVVALLLGIFLVACAKEEPVSTTESTTETTTETKATTETEEAQDTAKEEEQVTVSPEEENQAVMNIVKKVEILDHTFSNYGILFESYISRIEGLFIQGDVPVFNEDTHIRMSYAPSVEEAKAFTEEQRKVAQEALNTEVTIEVSDVLDDEAKGWKYVYTKSTVVDSSVEEGPVTFTLFRRYLLSKQDNEWRILTIDQFKADQDTAEENIQFNKWNNEPVQYTGTISFVQ